MTKFKNIINKFQVQNSAQGVYVMNLNEDDDVECREESSALRNAYNNMMLV